MISVVSSDCYCFNLKAVTARVAQEQRKATNRKRHSTSGVGGAGAEAGAEVGAE